MSSERWRKSLYGLLLLGILASARGIRSRPATDDQPKLQFQIAVLPLGKPTHQTLTMVESALRRTFRVPIVELPSVALPRFAYYSPRKRYRAEKLLAYMSRIPRWKVIGVTDKDVSTTAHGFQDFGVMGLGDLGGKAGVVSSFRAKAGVGQVAIHEVGHMLGLPHCLTPGCIMADARGTAKIAKASPYFCANCRSKISRWLILVAPSISTTK